MLNTIDKILEVCKKMDTDRNVVSIWEHLLSELNELKQEIVLNVNGQPPGPDGVRGEAVDMILCLVDLVYKMFPDVTAQDFYDTAVLKLDKWQKKYGRPEDLEIVSETKHED